MTIIEQPKAERVARLFLLLVFVLLIGGCSSSTIVVPRSYEAASNSARTITLNVPAGVGDSVKSVKVVRETPTEVVVEAKIKRSKGTNPGMEVILRQEVTLSTAIEDRQVRDISGAGIPRAGK